MNRVEAARRTEGALLEHRQQPLAPLLAPLRVHARMPASAKSAATASLCDCRLMPCVDGHDAAPPSRTHRSAKSTLRDTSSKGAPRRTTMGTASEKAAIAALTPAVECSPPVSSSAHVAVCEVEELKCFATVFGI